MTIAEIEEGDLPVILLETQCRSCGYWECYSYRVTAIQPDGAVVSEPQKGACWANGRPVVETAAEHGANCGFFKKLSTGA